MKNNLERMQEIQELLTKHINSNIKDEDDHMYMATMLLKHALVLYKGLLTDDQIKSMLGHVIDTIEEDIPGYGPTKKIKKTMH